MEKGNKVLTMAEYIKREYAIDAVLDVYYNTPDINLSGEKFEAAILKIPAADVAPVRHGKWRYYHKQNIAVCTECSFERNLDANFGRAVSCPNCGAKMDGGADK